MKNNEIFLSWSLDLGQSKVKKLRKLYHAIADFLTQNFEAIWSNCLNLIIIYKNHEALNFFLSSFYFIWNISEPLINEFSLACIIKKHLLLWAITLPSTSSRCKFDKQCFCYLTSFPLISLSNKIECPWFPISNYTFFEFAYGVIKVS